MLRTQHASSAEESPPAPRVASVLPLGSYDVSHWQRRRRLNTPAIAAILLLHGGILYGLLHLAPMRKALTEAAPLLVSFVPAAPAAKPEPPLPKPQTPRPRRETHLLATRTPNAILVPPAPPYPLPTPPIAESPPPEPPAPPEPAVPVVPPNFVAAYLDNPAPPYPPLSRRLHESGKVILRVRVNTDGRSETIEISQSSGYGRLDQSALETVHRWRFVAAHQGSLAVAAWVLIPINFQLDP